jgi:hypothetical protein
MNAVKRVNRWDSDVNKYHDLEARARMELAVLF